MAKEKTIDLAAARENLKAAEGNYEKLVKKSMVGATLPDRNQHAKDCWKSLGKKRYAKLVVDSLERKIDVPSEADWLAEQEAKAAARRRTMAGSKEAKAAE